jgi:hypothetical protein
MGEKLLYNTGPSDKTLYKQRSGFAVGVARNRTLTVKSHEC